MQQKYLLKILFVILISGYTNVSYTQADKKSFCDSLINTALQASEKNQHARALELLFQARTLAKTNGWHDKEFLAANYIGNNYRILEESGDVAALQAALRLQAEFGYELIIDHGTEAHVVADLLAERGVPVLIGPLFTTKSKMELRKRSIANPGKLAKAGVELSIITDHPVIPISFLVHQASFAVREGLDRETALRRARTHLKIYTGLPNYRNSWRRQGFGGCGSCAWRCSWWERSTMPDRASRRNRRWSPPGCDKRCGTANHPVDTHNRQPAPMDATAIPLDEWAAQQQLVPGTRLGPARGTGDSSLTAQSYPSGAVQSPTTLKSAATSAPPTGTIHPRARDSSTFAGLKRVTSRSARIPPVARLSPARYRAPRLRPPDRSVTLRAGRRRLRPRPGPCAASAAARRCCG